MFKFTHFYTFLFLLAALILSSLPFQQKTFSQAGQIILIPIEKITFNPARSEFIRPGEKDFTVTVTDYEPISDNAICRFIFRQTGDKSPIANPQLIKENISESRYLNKTCSGTLPANQQVASDIILLIEIANPGGQIVGSYINYFTNSDTPVEVIDPNQYTIPKELYTEPEIKIILEKTDLRVGDKVNGQLEVTNKDTFVLTGFVLTSKVQEKNGKLDCDSFEYTDQPLNGSIVKNPFVIEASAQVANEANCLDDQYAFEAKLSTLQPNKTSRLNFSIDIEQPGELKFDILTNLNQNGITRTTQPIEIKPREDEDKIDWWVYALIIISLILLILAAVYYGRKYYKKRKLERSKPVN